MQSWVAAPIKPIISVLALSCLLGAGLVLAQDEADTQSEPADAMSVPAGGLEDASTEAGDDLDAVTDRMRLTRERIEEIRAEIAALDGDATELGAQLAAAGQRVEMAEGDVRLIEERLEELFSNERAIRVRLDGHDRSIANLLASLQTISANPPPALVVDPTDALGSARAALLLGAVLPQLQERASDVTGDLDALQELKAEAEVEAEVLNANLTTLNEERLRIATIIEARTRGLEWLSEDLLREESEAQALADRARSLEQLIEGLESRIAAVNAVDAANRAARLGQSIPTLDPETIELAFADPDRTEPAIPFETARGYLTAPANGVAIMTYGAADGYGGTAQGLSIATRADAPVLAPADGWVVYTGPFLNYGEIVILNAGQDYMIVLAGLARVEVERGQFLRMGTPVGAMGQRPIGRVAGNAGADGPMLYVELREGGIPIDPQGWWTALPEQEESGSS